MSRAKIAGVGLAVGLIGGYAGAQQLDSDNREVYPAGMVCVDSVGYGRALGDAADESHFEIDVDGLVARSQFLDPAMVLRYGLQDESVPTRSDDLLNVSRPGARCDFVEDPNQNDVVSVFPTVEAATKILHGTVALAEATPRSDEVPRERRCAGIAVSSSVLILPSQELAWDHFNCSRLGVGETQWASFGVNDDTDRGQLRAVEQQMGIFDPVELATDYEPAPDDVLVYSGYNREGGREYFRIRVSAVHENGKYLLLQAGIDQTAPQSAYETRNNESAYRALDSGNGGIFTTDGKLVALTYGAEYLWDWADSAGRDQEAYDRIQEHNDGVTKNAEFYGYDIRDAYDINGAYRNVNENQLVHALRITPATIIDLKARLDGEG